MLIMSFREKKAFHFAERIVFREVSPSLNEFSTSNPQILPEILLVVYFFFFNSWKSDLLALLSRATTELASPSTMYTPFTAIDEGVKAEANQQDEQPTANWTDLIRRASE